MMCVYMIDTWQTYIEFIDFCYKYSNAYHILNVNLALPQQLVTAGKDLKKEVNIHINKVKDDKSQKSHQIIFIFYSKTFDNFQGDFMFATGKYSQLLLLYVNWNVKMNFMWIVAFLPQQLQC